jgi:hypothetical protein
VLMLTNDHAHKMLSLGSAPSLGGGLGSFHSGDFTA